MKTLKNVLPRAAIIFLIFTLLCGVVYTGVVTGFAQLIFPDKANGSIIEVDGKKYGCELLGQQYTDDGHMWGRIMNIDVSTYKDENGKTLMYAAPSNLSPASEEYEALVKERVEKLREANPDMDETAIPVDLVTCSGSGLDPHISPAAAEYQVARIAKANDMTEDEVRVEKLREANPDMDETAIPVDLVTCSGSGLDPHISPAAAEYQVARIAKANDMTEDEVREIIKKCTDGKFLGVFGEETVNVLKVNLMLDGIL